MPHIVPCLLMISDLVVSTPQILATAYIRHEPWKMGVHKRNGVVYLDVHKIPERPKSELDRRRYSIALP